MRRKTQKNDSAQSAESKKRGGARSYALINEPGLYRLIFASRKLKARGFQHWVFHEILPALRREELRLMIRSDSKATRLNLTEEVKKFIEYLDKRGELDRVPIAWYVAFTNLANKAAGIEKGDRDNATPLQLLRLQDAEDKLALTLAQETVQGKSHHDIWLACQEKLEK